MVFATAEKALKPRSTIAKRIAWVYAAILASMAISQLFAFEDFVPLMRDMMLPGGNGTASLVACLVVFAEVLSVPFLLRMGLSPLMRWFSLGCGLFVPVVWLSLSFWAFHIGVADGLAVKGGILGTKVFVPNVYQLAIAVVLIIVAIYAVYGLWPAKRSSQK